MKRTLFVLITLCAFLTTFVGATYAGNSQQAIFERPILIVNTGFLNIRSGPSAQFAIVATVAGGTELGVLGTAGDGIWYQVALNNGQSGWVNVEFTIPRGDFTNVPLVSTDAPPTVIVQDNLPIVRPVTPESGGGVIVEPAPRLTQAIVIVNTSALNVRSGPGAQYTTLITVSGGTEFPVIGVTTDGLWYGVRTASGDIGFVNAEFVIFRGNPESILVVPYSEIPEGTVEIATPIAIANTSFLNVRSGPGAQYTVVTTVRGGAELPVQGLASDGVWFLVDTPNGQGWVNNEFVIFRGTIEVVPIIDLSEAGGVVETPVALIGDSVQLFAAPAGNFGLLGSIVGPVEAPIVARTPDFDWIQINTSVGFGWIPADQVLIRGDVGLIPTINN